MRPPKIIKPYVTSFARSVTKIVDVDLTYIKCTPIDRTSDGDCFPCVERQVTMFGGESIMGWAIWERPKVFIEAEFHAVWRSSDGVIHDIVPRKAPIPRILFVCEPFKIYKGIQIDNIRKSLCNDKDVKELLRISGVTHKLWNEGELAKYHGPVELNKHPKLLAAELEKNKLSFKLDNRYGAWTHETIQDS